MSFLYKRFFPKLKFKSVYEIDYEHLRGLDISALVFDLDNTVAPYDVELPDTEAAALFGRLRAMGFKLCFLSNNRSGERVRVFARALGEDVYTFAKANKPSTKGMKQALGFLGAQSSEAAIIGDQIFTDIWCGNRSGVLSVLVEPLSGRDEFTVRLKRPFEKPVLRAFEKYVK
jgi:hypothetical protein